MAKIVSDTSTLYSISEGAKHNIAINPLNVTINNKTYLEFEEISPKEFLGIINEGHLPTSSQPSIGRVLDSYEQFKDEPVPSKSVASSPIFWRKTFVRWRASEPVKTATPSAKAERSLGSM